MANPSLSWDRIPVFGWWSDNPGVPASGTIEMTMAQRVRRADGRMIYPGGATRTVAIGNRAQQDPDIRAAVKAAMKAKAQADQGAAFDNTAWEARWEQNLNAAIFTSFWAADDPDITPHGIGEEGYQVLVNERLQSSAGSTYYIQPLIFHLEKQIPGINLADIDVPPGGTTPPQPIYAKGQPGGIAPLDNDGDVVNAYGIKVGDVDPTLINQAVTDWLNANPVSGVSSWDDLQDKPTNFPPEFHNHEISDVIGLEDALAAGGGGGGFVTWDNIQDKPSQFPPSSHGHGINDITDLDTELANRAPLDHVYSPDALPPGSVLQVVWTGPTWPPRPTERADVSVWWIGGPATPPPGALVSDVHFPRVT